MTDEDFDLALGVCIAIWMVALVALAQRAGVLCPAYLCPPWGF